MLLARKYNLFPGLDDLTGIDLLLIDHEILNRVIQSENETQEKANKKQKDASEHPGMERYDSLDDFWDEVDAAKAA